ncbi:hypothetical protein D3C71_1793490 [compost metagenome]
MSTNKHLKRRVRELEGQMEKLVDIVGRLTACGHQVNEALSAMPAAFGSAVGGQLATHMAITEREKAAHDGLHIDH